MGLLGETKPVKKTDFRRFFISGIRNHEGN